MKLAILILSMKGMSGGGKKYLKFMIPRFIDSSKIDKVYLISPHNLAEIIQTLKIQQNFKYEYHVFKSNKNIELLGFATDSLRLLINKLNPDILFIPMERYISINNVPIVNMVRNMEPFVYTRISGEPITESIKKIVQKYIGIMAIKKASHTIAPSKYVKDYLINKIGLNEKRISLIYHGIECNPDSNKKPILIDNMFKNNFIFTCGSIRPARGLEDIIFALIDLKKNGIILPLAIAGDVTPGAESYKVKLKEIIELHGMKDNILWLGELNEKEMNWCFQKCILFVMSSRVEACPNIALEAMANGAISVVANNPPLPEFFGKCAIYYEPKNYKSLADAIKKVIKLNSSYINKIKDKVINNVAFFSWDKTAQQTIKVLENQIK